MICAALANDNLRFPMDFDPDHPKWQCCCCNLSSGLKILGSIEAFFSAVIILIVGFNMFSHLSEHSSVFASEFIVLLCLLLVAVFYGVASILMVAGIHLTLINYMYPTLVARTVLLIFVQAFGVSVVVKPREDAEVDLNSPNRVIESSVTFRLFLLIFFMIFISIAMLYTIYLVVRCMQYVTSYRKLIERRHSLIAAGQIDQCYSEAMNQTAVSA